jgi:hypothetical protein
VCKANLIRFVLIAILLVSTASSAQTPAAKAEAARRPLVPRAPEVPTQLPVTRVALYKNGVGFFEHSGKVTGSESVTIDFTTAQLNDVLQSLTAIDLNGGRIAGAGYNSTTPLEQQLKALPLALGEDPTAVDFYNAIRGARVEVHSGAATITGRLLNIEVVNSEQTDKQPATQKRLITVIAESGEVRTLELTPATEVRLLDADLHQDVTRYLQLLASTRNQGLRHLTLQDNGTGARELHVSYISEVPIWKSTYRILFTDHKPAAGATTPATAPAPVQTATLQGWSVVDNTTGSDWNNVQLSLIAGAPQSFIQPLSIPYYSRRPEIPLPQEAQLTPQTHQSGDLSDEKVVAGVAGMSGMGSGIGAGSGGNYGGGVAGGVMGGMGAAPPPPAAAPSATLRARSGNAAGRVISGDAVDALSADQATSYQSYAFNSLAPNATTAAFDDYFAYNLAEPITIRKNESAMVSILQTKIDAERVTLWSPRQPVPLRALWITNTSELTLDRGSFSIVEDGNFGGEGLLDPIHPAEKRLLSYAVDQAVRVTAEGQKNTTEATSVTASKGVLVLHHTQLAEVTYVVHNAAPEARTVVVEHPVREPYVLDDADPKPIETTPTAHRYRVAVAAGATERLHIGEHHKSAATYHLTSSNDNQLTLILNQADHTPALEAALAPIFAARRHQADMQTALDKIDSRLKDLRADEDRQRANVTALTNSDKAARERFVRDLNATEDQIAAAQKGLTSAQVALQAAKDDLANKIETLQIDEKL